MAIDWEHYGKTITHSSLLFFMRLETYLPMWSTCYIRRVVQTNENTSNCYSYNPSYSWEPTSSLIINNDKQFLVGLKRGGKYTTRYEIYLAGFKEYMRPGLNESNVYMKYTHSIYFCSHNYYNCCFYYNDRQHVLPQEDVEFCTRKIIN